MARHAVARLLPAALLIGASLPPTGTATAQAPAGSGPPSPLLAATVGRWDVKQTMWAGPDASPREQPPAIATRRVAAGGGFVEEEMTPAAASTGAFTRTSHVNYNAIDGVFEYFSIDTRAPHADALPVAAGRR